MRGTLRATPTDMKGKDESSQPRSWMISLKAEIKINFSQTPMNSILTKQCEKRVEHYAALSVRQSHAIGQQTKPITKL